MPKVFTSKTQKIGELGEDIATKYLISKGFKILERNYTRKYGEIDVSCEKNGIIHFVEVKSVTRESNTNDFVYKNELDIRPEDNMHPKKIERLYRTIQTYLAEKGMSDKIDWQLDLVCIYLDQTKRKARVKILENIV